MASQPARAQSKARTRRLVTLQIKALSRTTHVVKLASLSITSKLTDNKTTKTLYVLFERVSINLVAIVRILKDKNLLSRTNFSVI